MEVSEPAADLPVSGCDTGAEVGFGAEVRFGAAVGFGVALGEGAAVGLGAELGAAVGSGIRLKAGVEPGSFDGTAVTGGTAVQEGAAADGGAACCPLGAGGVTVGRCVFGAAPEGAVFFGWSGCGAAEGDGNSVKEGCAAPEGMTVPDCGVSEGGGSAEEGSPPESTPYSIRPAMLSSRILHTIGRIYFKIGVL